MIMIMKFLIYNLVSFCWFFQFSAILFSKIKWIQWAEEELYTRISMNNLKWLVYYIYFFRLFYLVHQLVTSSRQLLKQHEWFRWKNRVKCDADHQKVDSRRIEQNKDRCCEVIQCEVMEFLHCQNSFKKAQNNDETDYRFDHVYKPKQAHWTIITKRLKFYARKLQVSAPSQQMPNVIEKQCFQLRMEKKNPPQTLIGSQFTR